MKSYAATAGLANVRAIFVGIRQGRELGTFAIDLTAMTDFDHLYDPRNGIYGVHHTEVALANTIPTLGACKLLTAQGARFL